MDSQEYISDIIIENFQCHKETYLELSPGVNSLVGDTEAGKSAIFKALVWFFKNEPAGDEYRSHWGGDTQVAMCLQPSDIWVGRVRSSTKNYYWIDEDIKENRLHGFGKGAPPQQILDVCNIGDVNFMAQMTLPFLLSMTKGKAGKFYNEAADLDIVNRSINNAAAMVRGEKNGLKSEEIVKKQLEEKLKKYNWIDGAEGDLEQLLSLDKEITDLDEYANRLDKLAQSIDDIDREIEAVAPILNAEAELKKAVVFDENIALLSSEADRLDDLIGSIEDIQKDIDSGENVLKFGKEVDRLLEIDNEIKINTDMKEKLARLISSISVNDKDILYKTEEMEKMEDEFHKLMPDQCPLCGENNLGD